MPIASSDIKYRLSGGASNTDPNLSLGGAKSSTDAGATLFDNVSSAEASAGHTDYRIFYVHNNHGTLTLQNAKVWLSSNTPSPDTDCSLAVLGAVNSVPTALANENTAPGGASFTSAATEGAAVAIGNMTPGQHQAVCVRRIVTASAGAYTGDGFTLRAKGDTSA